MLHVHGKQVRLEDAVDSGEALDGLARRLGRLDRVHEGGESVVGRLGLLGVRAQLGQPLAPGIGVLGVVPHVAAEEELGGELWCQRDPAGQDARHALGGVAVVAAEAGGVVRREVPFEDLHGDQRPQGVSTATISRPGSAAST